ncbi:hypothetical protein PybrP1_012256, partial [[Pythium] brassicae (nom. inval.)]
GGDGDQRQRHPLERALHCGADDREGRQARARVLGRGQRRDLLHALGTRGGRERRAAQRRLLQRDPRLAVEAPRRLLLNLQHPVVPRDRRRVRRRGVQLPQLARGCARRLVHGQDALCVRCALLHGHRRERGRRARVLRAARIHALGVLRHERGLHRAAPGGLRRQHAHAAAGRTCARYARGRLRALGALLWRRLGDAWRHGFLELGAVRRGAGAGRVSQDAAQHVGVLERVQHRVFAPCAQRRAYG